jgi:hypothetical protein
MRFCRRTDWEPMKKIAFLLGTGLLLAACAAPPPQTAPKPPPREEPKSLSELNAVELAAAFGVPDFVRKENGIRLWRYDVGACRIFFYFYGDGGSERVRYVESLPRGTIETVSPSCLSAFDLRRKKKS